MKRRIRKTMKGGGWGWPFTNNSNNSSDSTGTKRTWSEFLFGKKKPTTETTEAPVQPAAPPVIQQQPTEIKHIEPVVEPTTNLGEHPLVMGGKKRGEKRTKRRRSCKKIERR